MTPLRVGRVRYINCDPVYYGIEKGVVAAECEIVDGTPADLNAKLRGGAVDLSVISSVEYAQHPEEYLLLPDLAIACDGPVESVLFLSRLPCDALDGQTVLLTQESLTSLLLIQILLAKSFGVHPRYLRGEIPAETPPPPEVAGLLLIGDPALRSRRLLPHRLDLGQGWKELTGLPFLFALWAVRRDVYQARPDQVHALHQALLASKAYSLAHLDTICDEVYPRVGISRQICARYLRERLSFDLTAPHLEGLRCFLTMAAAAGLLPGGSPPFVFIGETHTHQGG